MSESSPAYGLPSDSAQASNPTFVSRDYGDREVPDGAVDLGGDEADTIVYAWAEGDSDSVFVQQGYDLIVLDPEQLAALYNFARIAQPTELAAALITRGDMVGEAGGFGAAPAAAPAEGGKP